MNGMVQLLDDSSFKPMTSEGSPSSLTPISHLGSKMTKFIEKEKPSRKRFPSLSFPKKSRNSEHPYDPIIAKESKRTRAKRAIQNNIIKPLQEKRIRAMKVLGPCLVCSVSSLAVLFVVTTFLLPNLFMFPSAYVAVSSKHHLISTDAELYRKLTHSSVLPEPLLPFPDNTITSSSQSGETDGYKKLKIEIKSLHLFKDHFEPKKTFHDVEHELNPSHVVVHPPFVGLEHEDTLKGVHKERLIDYITTLPHKNDPLMEFNLPYKNVTFSSLYDKTLQLRGWFIPAAPEFAESKKVVILLHGAFYDRRDVMDHVPYIHKLGVHVLLFDMINHGVSDGDQGCTLAYREWIGIVGAVDYLESIIPDVEVAMLGSSTGATSSIIAASQDPRIKAVVAENPFANRVMQIRDVLESALYKNGWSHQLPKVMAAVIESIGNYIPEFVIKGVSVLVNWRMCDFSVSEHYHVTDVIQDMEQPLLLIHSKTDKVVAFKHSEIIHSMAKGPTTFWAVEDAPHSVIHRQEELVKEFENRVISFLKQHFLTQ